MPWFQTSRLQNYRRRNFCCFKPLRLWYLIMDALGNKHTTLYISLSFFVLIACFYLCCPFFSISCFFSSLLWCISIFCPVLLRSTMDSETDSCLPGWKDCWNQFRAWQIGRWQRGVTICRWWYGLELGDIVPGCQKQLQKPEMCGADHCSTTFGRC